MRYSATWLSVCWAATMCSPPQLVWICWAGPDGLLKALPYGISETLHTAILRLKTVTPAVVSFTITVAINTHHFTVNESYRCATQKQTISIGFGDWLSFSSDVCIPLDVFLLLYFHVFSGLYVLLFSNGICAIEAECFLFNAKWCSAITSSWSVGTCCLYSKQCERYKEGLVSITNCIWNCNSIYLKTLESFWEVVGLCVTIVRLYRANANIHFSHTCCHCSYVLYK